jgi:hypothetical protein
VAAGKVPYRRADKLVKFTAGDLDEIVSSWRVAPLPRGPRRPGNRRP